MPTSSSRFIHAFLHLDAQWRQLVEAKEIVKQRQAKAHAEFIEAQAGLACSRMEVEFEF